MPSSTIDQIAGQLRRMEQMECRKTPRSSFSTGMDWLNRLLPDGGLRRGMLVEWLTAPDGGGCGVNVLALLTAKAALQREEINRGPLVIVDRGGTFYPPAAAAWGIDLANTILIRPANSKDEAWALDQAMRCEAVGAVLAWSAGEGSARLDGRAFRRLQLAAESSGVIGVFIRPAAAANTPTWADVRFQQRGHNSPFPTSSAWRLCIERLHARSCLQSARAIWIEIASDGSVREVPAFVGQQ